MNVHSIETDSKYQAILEATLTIVAASGLHDTPMAKIARTAGVSVGTVYHYFDGKEALLRAVFLQVKQRLGQAIMTTEPEETEEWQALLKQIWLNAFNFYVTHPQETLFIEQYENLHFHELDQINQIDENFAALAKLINRLVNTRAIKPLPLEVMYDLTLGVAVSLAKRQIAGSLILDDHTLSSVAIASCRALAA